MSETTNTDSAVIEGGELHLEIGGRKYTWKEPVRRQLRKMLRGLIAIDRMREGKAQDDPELMLDLVDAILDFFYAFHEGMAADAAHLDNCGEEEIANAFRDVAEFLQAPFAKMAKRAQAATRTQNPASMNS